MDSGTSTADGVYETVNDTSSVVAASAIGQTLFINFYGFQNNGLLSANTGFARIDNISVVSNAVVPEPSAYALLAGILALGVVFTRRRKV